MLWGWQTRNLPWGWEPERTFCRNTLMWPPATSAPTEPLVKGLIAASYLLALGLQPPGHGVGP